MAAAADQTRLVYTRLAQLAFVYIEAVRSSDYARASVALSVFQQAVAAHRSIIETGWTAAGHTLTPTLSASLGRVTETGTFNPDTATAIATVLMGTLPAEHTTALSSLPMNLPAFQGWAATFFTYVMGRPDLQALTLMAIDTYGTSIAMLPTVLAAYLQRPLTTRSVPDPEPPPPPTPRYVPPGTVPQVTPPPEPRVHTLVDERILGGRSKMSPWVIGALVFGVGGALVYLFSGLVAKKGQRRRR